ncbi:MAG: hypothetical protein AAF518_26785 [Spirochaetota bacterium]
MIDIQTQNRSKDMYLLTLKGDWDLYSNEVWNNNLAELDCTKQTKFLLNLKDVEYIDSTGMGKQIRLKDIVLEIAFAEMQKSVRLVYLCTSLHNVPFPEFVNNEKALTYLKTIEAEKGGIQPESQISAAFAFQKDNDHESALQVFSVFNRRNLKLSPAKQAEIWEAMAKSIDICGYDGANSWRRRARNILRESQEN